MIITIMTLCNQALQDQNKQSKQHNCQHYSNIMLPPIIQQKVSQHHILVSLCLSDNQQQ